MAMNRFAELCNILGDTVEADKWERRAVNIRKKFFPAFAHPSVSHCLRDSDTEYTDGYYMINFSCEFGCWYSSGAAMEFCLDSDSDRDFGLYVAEYAGFRVFSNGELCADKPHRAGWDRQPCYDPIQISLPLKKGTNFIRWEVKSNQLNFELFFRAADNGAINFYSPEGKLYGCASVEEYDFEHRHSMEKAVKREIRVRSWVPPLLSQSTHMYACISGIFEDEKAAQTILRRIMAPEYIRTYLSVRVPYFCTEAGEKREKDNWIMPVNTPWTGSFLLLALSKYGCAEIGLDMLRRFWGGMIDQDAVNTWEEWGNRSSLCHAWGATPAYFMLNQILGAEHALDCEGNIRIRPNLFDLKWAKGYVAVGRGGQRIYVSLKKAGDTTEVSVRIPEGVKAKIDLSRLKNPVLSD